MFFRAIVLLAGGGLLLGAAAIWGIQGIVWWEDGKMPQVQLRLLWDAVFGAPPAFSQPLLQGIAEWLLTQNAGLGFFVPGIALLYLGFLGQRIAEKRSHDGRGVHWDD